MIKRLCKNPKFLIGFSIVFLLMLLSFLYSIFMDGDIPKTTVIYDDNGNALSSVPHPPSEVPPFGTDMVGNEIIYILLKGAKYTIGIALIVAALRVGLGMVLSYVLESYLPRVNRFFFKIAEAFHYVPIALLAFLILSPVLMEGALGGFENTFWERVIFEIVILTLVAIPTLTTLLSKQMKLIQQHEFIEASQLMGSSKWQRYTKHVIPHLAPKMWIQYAQQVIQVLILLVHLGLLHILFGGAIKSAFSFDVTLYVSVTSEWSGIIGNTYQYLSLAPWIPISPLIMFAITILSMNLILDGLKKEVDARPTTRKKADVNDSINRSINEEDFENVNKTAIP